MYMNQISCDAVVVGGGPSGAMCAITAAQRGLSVILLEPNRDIGRKLRITGKGRCNVTNNCDIKTIMNNIPGDGRFLYSSLNALGPQELMNKFEEWGVPLKTERGNRVFPVSDNANDIAGALTQQLNKCGVVIKHEKVKRLLLNNGSAVGVETESYVIHSNSVAICTGGLSYPLTGSTGDGYKFAKSVGHSIVECMPSLVPLESSDSYCAQMQGFSLKNVQLRVFEDDKLIFSDFGEMMFTHFGITGPLVLSASSHMRKFGSCNYRVEIDLKPALDTKKLDQRVLRDFEKYQNRAFKNSLDDLAGKSMIPVLVKLSGIDEDTQVNSITKEQRKNLVELFKAFPVNITKPRPFPEAIITSGGVSTKEINPRTMESKIIKNLFFAGEVLNLDAYTGGFNLQIAWSTGFVAGNSMN